MADLDTVAIVTAALAGKRFRENLGGEWHIASCIVSRMAHATKCRASDDLLLAAENHPDFEDTRLAFAFRSTDDLIHIATGADPLPIRALAAWYAIGTDRRPSPRLSSRQGDPTAVFNALQRTGIPTAVVEIAHEGFRKTGEVLCPVRGAALASTAAADGNGRGRRIPTGGDDRGCPGLGLRCLFTRRPSRPCKLHRGPNRDCTLGPRSHPAAPARRLPRRHRLSMLKVGWSAHACDGRPATSCGGWSISSAMAPHCPDATEILQLMKADIPVLNDVRLQLIGGGEHVQ